MNDNINYTRTNFDFLLITKIVENPKNKALWRIKKEVVTNGTSVTYDLGGGEKGNLSLVLESTEYTEVGTVCYAFLKHPGALNRTGITTQYVRSGKCEHHRE